MTRITSAEREEQKKREKEARRRKEEEDEGKPLVWIKYPLGLKHQVRSSCSWFVSMLPGPVAVRVSQHQVGS